MRSVQEIFGRYLLIEQLDSEGIESWLGVSLDAADADAHVVVRRVPLWKAGRRGLIQRLAAERQERTLGAQHSLPRMVDAGTVGDVPFIACAYVPGVTAEGMLEAVRRGDVDPLSGRAVMVMALCLTNAMHAMEGVDPAAGEQTGFQAQRVVLPWDRVPVVLGRGQGAPPSQRGLFGLANLLMQLLTGHRALQAGEPVPDLCELNRTTPRALADVLSACLDGRFTEQSVGRFANAVEAILGEDNADAVEQLQVTVAQDFAPVRAAWEARRMVHERLRRRVSRDNSGAPATGMAKVVQVQFRRASRGDGTASRLTYEQLFADVQQDPAAFLSESTSDALVETVQELPVLMGGEGEPDRGPRGQVVRTADGRDMVRVPQGAFLWGPERKVLRLPEFLVDRYPVTNADYARFVKATGAAPPWHWRGDAPPRGLEDHPVVFVSHADAEAWAVWAGKQLPSEEQWEKAARGVYGWAWPHGREFDPSRVSGAWRRLPEHRTTVAVGTFSPAGDSPFGVSDIGQAWEWTATRGMERGSFVVRGGPWRNRREPPQVLNRSTEDRAARDVGFRCVVDPAALAAIRVD